jgi:aspartyl-tRNA(Asn)/glutamyl-tRNA(Gln) amidotransferase subunit A
MHMAEPILTIAEAAALIKARKLSPVELTQACLARIKAHDERLHSFILLLEEAALAAARQAEAEIMAGNYRGPLHGIPIGHKDIYCTKGIRTTAHSKVLKDFVPSEDATAVRLLAEAGTILLGKLATHEFAMGGPSFDLPWPPARNPWNTEHFTSGSSSGTGAAVAAGLALGGTGSDTGGSIRGPVSMCGIAGIKPTYGRVSRAGVLPLAFSMDHAGPMAWTSEDCAIMLQAMAGYDPKDPASADVKVPDFRAALTGDVKGLKIGVIRHFYERDNRANDAMRGAVDAALGVFEGLGAKLRDITVAPLWDWSAAGLVILVSEAYAVHEDNLRTRPHDYGERFRDRVSAGMLYSAADYIQAMRRRRELAAEFARAIADVDVVITTIVPTEAPRIDAVPKWQPEDQPSMMMPFNVTGSPSVAVCCGFTEKGLPLGMQIVGKPFDEATVLRAADAYERATGWRKRRPAL